MFWFMLIALVAVVAAVALAVLGNGGTLPEAEPDRLDDPLPADRPVHPADLSGLRLAVTLRGYRMTDVDDVLDRLSAELAERDARIAELESALAREAAGADRGGPPIVRQPYGERPDGEAPRHAGPSRDRSPQPAGPGGPRPEREPGADQAAARPGDGPPKGQREREERWDPWRRSGE